MKNLWDMIFGVEGGEPTPKLPAICYLLYLVACYPISRRRNITITLNNHENTVCQKKNEKVPFFLPDLDLK